jgi:hypothetical protein
VANKRLNFCEVENKMIYIDMANNSGKPPGTMKNAPIRDGLIPAPHCLSEGESILLTSNNSDELSEGSHAWSFMELLIDLRASRLSCQRMKNHTVLRAPEEWPAGFSAGGRTP